MPTPTLSKGSALDIHLGVGRPGYTVGREAGREEAGPAPATVRGNEERQLQSAPEARPGKTAAGASTKDFSDPAAKVPSELFFFFLNSY